MFTSVQELLSTSQSNYKFFEPVFFPKRRACSVGYGVCLVFFHPNYQQVHTHTHTFSSTRRAHTQMPPTHQTVVNLTIKRRAGSKAKNTTAPVSSGSVLIWYKHCMHIHISNTHPLFLFRAYTCAPHTHE